LTIFSIIKNELVKLNRKLVMLDKKMDIIIESHIQEMNRRKNIDVDVDVLKLPDYLRRSFLALRKLGSASSSDISSITKVARAVESSYLNQLVRLGWCNKKRECRRVIFYIGSDDNGLLP